MFEFFVFQAGGLVLWPIDCDTSRKNTHIIGEYVQKQLLEGKVSDELFVKDKIACLARPDPEHSLFFAVTLHHQVAQQVHYLKELLEGVSDKFLFQYEKILSQNDIVWTPSLFTRFSIDDIVEQFRGSTLKKPDPVTAPKETDDSQDPKKAVSSAQPRSSSVPPKKTRDLSPGKQVRVRHTDKKDNGESEQLSTVITGPSTDNNKVDIEQYDLDNFVGVFKPSTSSSGFFSGVLKGIIGEKILTKEVLDPFLTQFEQHLIAKNVAAHISAELTKAVGAKLEGTKCGTFSSIKSIVSAALSEQIERILTSHRNLDVIRDIQASKSRGQPYVLAFVGVNGVGKSTSLAKVGYLFKSHGFKVLITACDTFRSGAIDQLEEHSRRLEIELFQKGGQRRDPVPVAKESIQYAKENGFDVILIDTAGRMQNHEGLMKQIARLINEVKPDLTLFVAEALVGNNGSDQIQSFDSTLKRYGGIENAKGIDGIVLTKFDTIDDKVGAALTMVYETGHPIIFLGVGQTYRDLRKMNPEIVVSTLTSGF